MSTTKFILNQPVSVEETRHYEFKEIKGSNPVDTIKNTVDEYVVAYLNSEGGHIYWGIRNADRVVLGVQLTGGQRDVLRRVVGEKLSQIRPAIAPTAYRIEFHPIYEEAGLIISDGFVVEVIAPRVFTTDLYFTGGNEAFVKTDGGKKKLSGPELQDEILRRGLNNKANLGEPNTVVAKQRLDELLTTYGTQLESKVSRVKIFGDVAPYPLEKVFVELTINEDYDPRAGAIQQFSFLDAELRRLRSVFGDVDEDRHSGNTDPIKSVFGKSKLKPDELLSQPTHAIITGAPGCGKTTLMRYLSWQTLKQWRNALSSFSFRNDDAWDNVILKLDARFPIFLELKQLTAAEFARVQGKFEDLLFEKVIIDTVKPQNESEHSELRQCFRKLLSAGRVAIFLDGLDEVSGTGFFNELQASVSAFLQSAYGRNLVVISTRPFALRQLGDAQLMEIVPFDSSQIEQFIKHYYGDTPESRRFKQELQRRRELRELARVPALLGFILQLWRKDHFVSDSKLELYDAVCREQAQQLDSDKEGVLPERKWLVTDPDGSIKRDFMRRLAFDMLFKGIADLNQKVTTDIDRLVFTSDTLLKVARQFADRIKQLEGMSLNPRHLVEDAKATVLLRQVGADKYAFTHLTLQEYLAALELAEREDCERVFCRAYFNPTLVVMEVLPMTLGAVNDPDRLYRVVNQLPESLNSTGMHLLARGLDYGAVISDYVLHNLSNKLIDFVCQSNINIERSEFVRSFAWLGKRPSYCKVIVALLKHEESAVRGRAAALLGIIGDDKVVVHLLNALSDLDSDVRGKVAEALGKIGDKRAVALLLKSLEKDLDNQEHYEQALYKLEQLSEDHITNSGIKKLQELIMQSILDDSIKNVLVRDLSIEGLSDFLRNTIRAYCLEGMHIVDEKILRHHEREYREGEVHTISQIVCTSQDNMYADVREKALALIEEIGEDQVIEILHKELELKVDEAEERRKTAMLALLKIGRRQSLGALLKALKDMPKPVRWRAIVMMSQMKPEVLAGGLLQAMSHEDAFARKKSAEVVGYYATAGVKEELFRLATYESDEDLRETAHEALRKFKRKLYYFDIPTSSTLELPTLPS